jgi:Family of unknown function (DUF6527)
MPTLRELKATFVVYFQESADDMFKRGVVVPADCFRRTDSLVEAHGIRFLCPKSFAANSGGVITHSIQVYFYGSPVPAHLGRNKNGKVVRWNVSGAGLDDLSLTPSIQEEDGHCKWHGFVGSGGVPPGSAQ